MFFQMVMEIKMALVTRLKEKMEKMLIWVWELKKESKKQFQTWAMIKDSNMIM